MKTEIAVYMNHSVRLLCGVVLSLIALNIGAQPFDDARTKSLIRMVRQDCGSCHGMRLTGGLGPALTKETLADKPLASLASTIYFGRAGTPMPGWRAMISEEEAMWIAKTLQSGFPEESVGTR